MRPIAIDFAQRHARPAWWAALMLIAAGVALGTSLWRYAATHAEVAAMEQELATAQAAADRNRAPATQAPAIPEARVRAINAAIARLNLPWAELFTAFEKAKPPEVALLTFEPDGRKRLLVVQAESKTAEQMIGFVDRLKQAPVFEDAVLTRHELRAQDPGRPLRFSVELRWREDIP